MKIHDVGLSMPSRSINCTNIIYEEFYLLSSNQSMLSCSIINFNTEIQKDGAAKISYQ